MKKEDVWSTEKMPKWLVVIVVVIAGTLAGLFIWFVGSILHDLGIAYPWNYIGAALLIPVVILGLVLLALVSGR